MKNRLAAALTTALAFVPVLAQAGVAAPPIAKVPVPGVLGLLAAGGVAAIVAIRNRRK